MRPVRRRALLLIAPLALVLTTSCQAAFRNAAADAPHAAVPAIVDETLKAGEDAPTRQRLVAVLGTPEMQEAISRVSKVAVAAALDEASSEASEERVAELTKMVSRALARSIATEMRTAVGTLVEESTSAAMRAAAKDLPTTLAPAVRESLVRELDEPDLHAAVSGLVGDAARQAILSTRDTVVAERMKTVAEGRVGLLDRFDSMIGNLRWALAIGFGVITLGLAAWLLHMRRQTRRFRNVLLELLSPGSEGERKSVPDPVHAARLRELLQ